jgi:hypothetical protein
MANEDEDSLFISPYSSQDNGQKSLVNGIDLSYVPSFMQASLNAGYLKDDSQVGRTSHNYYYNVRMPVPTSDIYASYGVNAINSRASSTSGNSSYSAISPRYGFDYNVGDFNVYADMQKGMNPMYGMNYNSGNFNAFVQGQKGQSPYFGVNYFKQF